MQSIRLAFATTTLAAAMSLSAFAQGDANFNIPPHDPSKLTQPEARDLKADSKADYKARKQVAEANEDLQRADCKTTFEGGVERACKKQAKAAAKHDKADAKLIHEAEKADIKSVTEK